MALRSKSPEQILSEAVVLRAQAYRRWRGAAQTEPTRTRRRVYEQLAALECDRYEELLHRFLAGHEPQAGPALKLPTGSSRRVPLRVAAIAAEAERRTWASRLQGTDSQSPERHLLTALVDEARRVRKMVATS